MPKRFKTKLFSIKLCRSKQPPCLSQKQTLAFDDFYPIVPETPPTTPIHPIHKYHYSTSRIVPIPMASSHDCKLIKETKSKPKCDSLYSSRSFGSSDDFGSPLATINEDPIEGDPESVVVVKRSENPYEDFKWSMLEMIMEKEMYGVKDLEQLLQRFLSLNSVHYHGAIIEAFAEVWGDLFGNVTDSVHV